MYESWLYVHTLANFLVIFLTFLTRSCKGKGILRRVGPSGQPKNLLALAWSNVANMYSERHPMKDTSSAILWRNILGFEKKYQKLVGVHDFPHDSCGQTDGMRERDRAGPNGAHEEGPKVTHTYRVEREGKEQLEEGRERESITYNERRICAHS